MLKRRLKGDTLSFDYSLCLCLSHGETENFPHGAATLQKGISEEILVESG